MSDSPDSPPRLPRTAYAIAALAIAVRLIVAVYSRFTSEDFLITLRYADNLAHGQGLVYNPGEHVLGTTTPLYTLFLAAVSRLHLPAWLLGKSVNVLADGALCLLVYRLLLRLREERAGAIAALCVALCPLQIQWSISGMETSLVSCCVLAIWTAFAERNNRGAFLLSAVLFLLRWDGILVFGVLTLAVLWRDRRLPLSDLMLFLLLISPWLVVATRYYGNPIPVTAAAKSIVYGWRADHDPVWLLRHLPGLTKLGARFLFHPAYGPMTLLAIAGFVRARRAKYTALFPPFVWFGLYWMAFLASRVLLFPWYLVPPFPVYEVAVGLGAAALWEGIQRRKSFVPSRAIAIACICVVAASCTVGACVMTRGEQQVEEQVRIPLGQWLLRNTRPSDVVMLEPIGYIGYVSNRPILDVVGLVSPQVLRFYRPENEAPLLEMARTFRPEWCVLRPGELARIAQASRRQDNFWATHYQPVVTFSSAPNENVYMVFQRIP